MAEDPPSSPQPGGWLPPEQAGEGQQVPPQQGPPQPAPGTWGQPGYGQGWQQQSPYGQGSPWAATYYYSQAEPDNTPAVAGFIMAVASIGALVMFFGLIAPITLCVSIAAVFVARNGRKKVERGETTKNKDMAAWGFWLGIAGAVLSALALAAWIALIASDPDWIDDDSTPRERGEPVRVLGLLAGVLGRLLG